jgi:hypothetical protein
MKLKHIINSSQGKIIMSIILGLGIATLFREVCKDRKCMVFRKAKSKKIDNKIFKNGDKCYQYNLESTNCNKNKKTVQFA